MYFLPIPKSLKEVGERVTLHGEGYQSAMKEFIDYLIRDLKMKGARTGNLVYPIEVSAYEEEPPEVPRELHRVHLAGMCEHLANLSARQPPDWCLRQEFFLQEPVFIGGPAGMKTKLVETPAAFRKRLLFCGPALEKLWVILDAERGEGSDRAYPLNADTHYM